MKKELIIFLLVVIAVAAFFLIKNNNQVSEDTIDDTFVPIATDIPETPTDVLEHVGEKSDLIVVNNPAPLSVIDSPLTFSGEARGSWYFEADFPVVLVDWDGRIIGEGIATAQEDWMTEEFVPFEGTIEFDEPSMNEDFSKRGALIFQKSNPSGLPENDDALEIPILFAPISEE